MLTVALIIMLTIIAEYDCEIIPVPTSLQKYFEYELEHCHTIIFEGASKNWPNYHTRRVYAELNLLPAVRLTKDFEEKPPEKKEKKEKGRKKPKKSKPDKRFETALTTMQYTYWMKRKEPCQVVYILNPTLGEDYCRLKKQFQWLTVCTQAYNREDRTCFARHLYFIWIQTIDMVRQPVNSTHYTGQVYRDDPHQWECVVKKEWYEEGPPTLPKEFQSVAMHEYLVRSKPGPDCDDANGNCPYWASIGKCTENPWYRVSCKKSCKLCGSPKCHNKHKDCPLWVPCNTDSIKAMCPLTCGLCPEEDEDGILEVSTSIPYPCGISKFRAMFDHKDMIGKYGSFLPRRALLDAQLKDLLMRGCPATWAILIPYMANFQVREMAAGRIVTGSILKDDWGLPKDLTSYHILREIVGVFNRTENDAPDPKFVSEIVQKVWVNHPQHLSIRTSHFPTPPYGSTVPWYSNMYVRKKTTFNFITCAGTDHYLSFHSFYEPFRFDFWVILGPSFIAVTIFVYILFKIYGEKEGAIFFMAKVLMEQGVDESGKLNKLIGFKFFFSFFLLVCVILTNLYRGEVTKNMTAPVPYVGLQTVGEAIEKGLKILVPFPAERECITCATDDFNRQNQTERFRRGHFFLFMVFLQYSPFLQSLIRSMGGGWRNYTSLEAIHPGLLESIKLTPVSDKNELEKELLRCEDAIYLDERVKLEAVALKGKTMIPSAASKFYYGSSEEDGGPFDFQTFWIMGPMAFDRIGMINVRFQSTRHSGIFDRVYEGVGTESYKTKQGIQRMVDDDGNISKLNIQSNLILGMFCIYFISVSACALVMIAEIVVKRLDNQNRVIHIM